MSTNQQVDFFGTGTVDFRRKATKSGKIEQDVEGRIRKTRRYDLAKAFEAAAQECTPVEEGMFHHILSLETKRSERSGRPFMLIQVRGTDSGIREIQRNVFAVIRDIDVVGWYEGTSVLGILFTEIAQGYEAVASTIMNRLTEAALQNIDPNIHQLEIRAEIHCCPKNDNSQVDTSSEQLVSNTLNRMLPRSLPPVLGYQASGD